VTTPRLPGPGFAHLDAPAARAAPAPENRVYLGFIASSLVVALAAGFSFGVVLPLSMSGAIPWEERVPHMLQAHGWAQLQGWAGLFVAGMSMRLVPLFSGRPAIRGTYALPVLVLLVVSVVTRAVAEPFVSGAPGDALIVAGGLAGAVAMAAVATALGFTLSRARRRNAPWYFFAWTGAAWWAAWGLLTALAALRAGSNGRLTPVVFDDTLTWIVLAGVIGNIIWAVQSRSVPIFFGRKSPPLRRVVVPWALLNAGALCLTLSLLPMSDSTRFRVAGVGLALVGGACTWLAPLGGAPWGHPVRLRARSRFAARYVLAANLSAMAGGLLLVWAGAHTVAMGEFVSIAARDAARHALSLGLVTMLAVGMARLITPIFALERAEARPAGILAHLEWWLLLSATVLRIFAGLALGHMDNNIRLALAATAGALGWLGLALFAFSALRAVRKEPRMKALLASASGLGHRDSLS